MTTEATILPRPRMSLTEAATPAARRRHWEMLIVAALAITLSFLLIIRPDGRVAFRGLTQYAAPETCPSHAFFHIDCPACGLTRSFIQLAHGDIASSLHYHHLGWMMALAVVLQLPYRIVGLRTNRILSTRAASLIGLAIIAALIGNWLLQMVA